MNQNEMKNAAEKVEGYYIPQPNDTREKAFERAKHETITNMTYALMHVQSLTLEQYEALTKIHHLSEEPEIITHLEEETCAGGIVGCPGGKDCTSDHK